MRKGVALCLFALVAAAPLCALGQHYDGVDSYEEYGKRIKSARAVAPVSDSVFGDKVSLYDGSTGFEVTDVSIPGNSAIPVAVGRELQIQDQRMVPAGGGALRGFADWSLDVPYVWGTFTEQNGWTLAPNGAANRCSDNYHSPYTALAIPGVGGAPSIAPVAQIWHGNQLHIPGQGNQILLANTESKSYAYTNGAYTGSGVWKWVTSGNWKLRCIGSVSNMAGEGFKAVSPTGVTYTFNYALTVPTSPFEWTMSIGLNTVGPLKSPRVNVYLLATHVEDRFGNWVNYSYDGNHLTGISSKDGRSITLNWTADTITSVTSALGAWTYEYDTTSWTNKAGLTITRSYLSTVTRPDGSKWTYAINAGSLITNKEDWPYDDVWPPNHCQIMPLPNSGSFQYTVGAPSGANATYWFSYGRHRRSYVPRGCLNNPDPNLHYPLDATNFFDNFYLMSKQVSGPGLVTATWDYDYGDFNGGYFRADVPWLNIAASQPYEPPGTCSDCDVSKVVTVAGPTHTTQYTYGVAYARNEGQLLKKEVMDHVGGPVLESTTYTYVSDVQAPGEPFPDIAGHDLRHNFIDPMGNRNRPVAKTVIQQDGVTFTTTVSGFDVLARGTGTVESSSLGSRTTATDYADNPGKWVLGQPAKSTVDGIVASQTDYNSYAQPVHTWRFGKLMVTRAWNATTGMLHSLSDGNTPTHVTTLTDWKRGLPQTVTFADGTQQSAMVNNAGWITSVKDEKGFITSYGYDLMGRLASVSYPTGDDVVWNTTNLSFTSIGSSEKGIPPRHWKRVVHTGNGYAVTYFDAFWRPLVTERYDSTSSARKASTMSQVVQRYDAGGRKVFMSYPTSGVTSYLQSLPGTTYASYDALDRINLVKQDSDIGDLPTTTEYLSGFRTKVTDPRNHSTVTSYRAYGTPDTSQPVSIAMPEGVTTTIFRDAFGKPLWIKRSGSYGGSPVSMTRSFVYDANQLLCKRIERETGATLFAYDGAGNLDWSAPGTALTSDTCDRGSVTSGQIINRGYDARNRLTSVIYPDGVSNTSYVYAPDGAMVSATTGTGSSMVHTTYGYNNRRLLTSEVLSVPGAIDFVVTHAYDVNGHPTALTYPDVRPIGFAPNALGQPTQAGSYATGVSYYPNGAIKQFTYGDGSIHTMTQDLRQLPQRSRDALLGNAVMDNTYNYDSNGNVAAITDGLPNNVGNVDMTYDDLNRLKTAVSPTFAGNDTASFSYDPLDNLRAAGVGDGNQYTYYYDAANRLTSLAGTQTINFGYDARGNLVSRNTQGYTVQAYTFDMANRLRTVNGLESYLYDAGGRRARKTSVGNGASTYYDYDRSGSLLFQWEPATMMASDYIYLGGSLVAKVSQSLSVTKGNIDGVDTDGSGTPVVLGWACSTGLNQSIAVELFAGPSDGGTRIGFYGANQPSDPTVANDCQASGTAYRFAIPLSLATRSQFANDGIYMVADSPVGNANNELIGSGRYNIPAPPPPAAPGSIEAPASSSTGTVTVSWGASDGATRYVLQQQLNGGAWTQAYSGSATSKTLTGLAGGSYLFRVQACNAFDCSGYKTSGTLTVTLPPASAPSLSGPSSSGSGTYTLSWNTVAGATRYQLNQSRNGAASSAVYNAGGTSWTSNNLGDGSYAYVVYACNASGCSGASNQVTVTVAHLPGMPASISVPASSSTGAVTVSWASASLASTYVLQQQRDGGSWTQVYTGSARSKAFSGLDNDTYVYRVHACNGNGCSGWRTSGTLTVALIPAPPASIDVPSSSHSASFSVSWAAPAHAINYVLEESINGGGWGVTWNGNATSTTVTVSSSGTYRFQVSACGAGGCSDFTASGNVAVTLKPTSAPSLAGPSSSSSGTFTLSWTAVGGATRYQLNQSINGGSWHAVYNGTGRSWASSALGNGSYAYRAYGWNAAGWGPRSNTVTVTVLHIPAAPASVTAPKRAKPGVTFPVSWSAVSGASRYELRQTLTDNGHSSTVYNGADTGTAITLYTPPDGVFRYAARACNSVGCSGWKNAPNTTWLRSAINPRLVDPAAGSSSQ